MKKFQKASDKIKKLADNHHFHFIDVNDGLSDENGNLKKELTFDGAHLNPAGYQLVLRKPQSLFGRIKNNSRRKVIEIISFRLEIQ
jgi:Lysophospholipase L1 and related esterases